MPQQMTDRFNLYRFKVDLILGRGGSGVVYRAMDPNTGQPVAVKLFHENFFSNRAQVKDLAKSVQKFREFKHPNVVHIRELIEGEEGTCMVMEYVDGPDLRWYVEQRPWNLKERLVICAQICNGLQYIHDQGFTHHDLKPANILFTRKGQVKITDYSLSRERLFGLLNTMTDQITPMYVAPELVKREKATPRSDIYSLGITFYLLFTGELPFKVDTLQKLYHCHLHVVPEHPSNVTRRCSRQLGDIIMKMIEKDPDRRFENCDQLRIKLAAIGESRI